MEKRKRRFGDRKEGRRVRSMSPMSYVIPYIMKSRDDAQIFLADSIDITETDKLLRELRAKGYKSLSILHVIIAAYIRAVAVRPGVNRFCSGQKIYHRDTIEVNMAVKREMSLEAPDTMIKVRFEPTDTLLDVYEKFNAVVESAVAEGGNEDFEKTAKILTKLPGLVFRFAVALLRFLDYFGWLPQFLLDVSPFHGSMIITSMGSLGIPPVFHHLYNFGNLPVFLSYGAKYRMTVKVDGEEQQRSMIDFKAVVDERICDGFYYASVFKLLRKMVANPTVLMTPPEKVLEDID
ncbi:MAG: 2-oxo acid dehydrogenase subunit E2 [Clostridia bacterium]|nr:2-oxo acid dehydrogenase subunit E2 [Clostridia bacterium]